MSRYSKCSNCGGEQVYCPEKCVIVCERCGSSFAVEEKSQGEIRRVYSSAYEPSKNKNVEVKYICSTCGAKSVVETDVEMKRCASCGNTTLNKQKTATVVPDGIIPFKISRKKAAEIFRSWVGSRKFAPGDLKQMAKLEKISGLYTPVWNFNFTSVCKYDGSVFKIKTDTNGNQTFKNTTIDQVKESRHEDVVVSGSTRISDSFLEEMGDYNFNQIKPYSTGYLLGFVGIDTNLNIHNMYAKMTDEISRSNERKIRAKLESEHDGIETLSCRTRFKDVAFNYTYVPVWANHYTYKGKEYHCYINGQTGKATGKAPKSVLKIGALILGIVGAILGGALLILKLL